MHATDLHMLFRKVQQLTAFLFSCFCICNQKVFSELPSNDLPVSKEITVKNVKYGC